MRAALLFVLACAVAADSSADDSDHVNDVLAVVRQHSKTNPVFAELEAATLTAAEEEEDTSKSGRSPIAEVAAMTDMMIIQTTEEIGTLTKENKKYQKMCSKTLAKYSANIVKQHRIETEKLAAGNAEFVNWVSKLPLIPAYNAKMAGLTNSIRKAENNIGAAGDRRAKKHKNYLKALAEHYKALKDVAAIRRILQNSKLDDKSHVGATNSAGAKSASSAQVNTLVEMKATVHPRLNNLVELASRSLESEAAMDKIYRLLYKTRDQLNQSMDKLIKSEATQVSNWRTNKIAFRNDINDMKILYQTTYKRKGTTKKDIGLHKKTEGSFKTEMQKAIKSKDQDQILKDFLEVSCKDAADEFARMFMIKTGEKAALMAVQKKLVEMKWSKKAYAAVEKVSEGVTYLKGEYNVRSNIGRYLINVKGTPQFTPTNSTPNAQVFSFDMNKDDMTFSIKRTEGKKHYYLQEDNKNGVSFKSKGPTNNNRARFTVVFDKKTNSFFFKNKETENTLYVDAKKGYVLNTVEQTFGAASQFKLERNDYEELGCFKNKIGKQLQHYLGGSNSLTTKSCFDWCTKSGKTFTYFGMSEGKQCFCGTSFDPTPAPYSDCGYLCKGRDGDLCGGNFRTLVFKVTPKKQKRVIFTPHSGNKCSREHATCQCTGTVWYGAKGKWAQRQSKGSIRCSNSVFGDPIYGTFKHCFCDKA